MAWTSPCIASGESFRAVACPSGRSADSATCSRNNRVPDGPPRRTRIRSLRGRLFTALTLAVLVLLALGSLLIYDRVLQYVDQEHDRSLVTNAKSVAALLAAEQHIGNLSSQARYLLAY